MMYAIYTEKEGPGGVTDRFYYAGYTKNGGPIVWTQDKEQAMWLDSMERIENLQAYDDRLSKKAGAKIETTD